MRRRLDKQLERLEARRRGGGWDRSRGRTEPGSMNRRKSASVRPGTRGSLPARERSRRATA